MNESFLALRNLLFAGGALLSGCSIQSDERRVEEIAATCGAPDLRLKRRGEVIVIDERRISEEVGVPFQEDTRQNRVHRIFFDCIRPKAERAGIRVDYPFTTIVD